MGSLVWLSVVLSLVLGLNAYEYEVYKQYPLSSWLFSFPTESGTSSGVKVVGNRTSAPILLCVPPKCGSMAAREVFRGPKLEWWGERSGVVWQDHGSSNQLERPELSHQIVTDYLVDAKRVRVAIVRHPVERIISAMRAFGVKQLGCERCKRMNTTKQAMHEYATKELVAQQSMDCDDARLRVNQHVRPLRCFCGFQLEGMKDRTHVLRFKHAADMAKLERLIPDSTRPGWNSRQYGTHRNLTAVQFLSPKHIAETTTHTSHTASDLARYDSKYDRGLIDAIYAAVAADLAFFADLGYFTEPGPPFYR